MSQTLGEVGKGHGADYPRTREQVDALPYAQLGVSRGEGARGVMILADVSGDELSWISGDRIQIVTSRNRVVRTTGLRSDYARSVLQGRDLAERYVPGATDLGDAVFSRVVRVEPGETPAVTVNSRFFIEAEERIEILGEPVDTVRVREELDVPEWRWVAVNRWWLSRQSTLAWRSEQHLTPDQPALRIEMLKRPA